MKFSECVDKISTQPDLKRTAAEYVIDAKRLDQAGLKTAILKTAPQYFNEVNVRNTVKFFMLNNNRNIRILFNIIIRNILLNCDDFTQEQRITDDKVIAYEQLIVNLANEFENNQASDLEFFQYVLEAAWEHNDNMSVDEQNLIDKIRARLGITEKTYCILDAKIGKYPQPGNILHTKQDISDARRLLQTKGIILSVRDTNNIDYDVIPEEIAEILRKIFNIDIKTSSYNQLLDSKYVKSKKFLETMLDKAGIKHTHCKTVQQLRDEITERMTAHELIGGFSPNDGLDKSTLQEWCAGINLPTSGTKPELISRIVGYYDNIKQFKDEVNDERELYYHYFTDLAARNLDVLRQQSVITKDLECEHKFEAATNYIFDTIFKNKPLIMSGTEHPDGMLSFNDKLIMWDNKSKETPVNLADHIKQFDRYIKNSKKPVAVFMVIAPDFTADSEQECVKYSLNSDTIILLITAEELKTIAEKWAEKHKNDEESLPLGYFKQSGRFNANLVAI